MKIAVCNTKQNEWSRDLCAAASVGIAACGDSAVLVNNESAIDVLTVADAAIVTCDAFPNRSDGGFSFRNAIAAICKFRGIPRLVIETGFMHNIRSLQRQETTTARLYWAAGWDGIKRNADYCVPEHVDSSRWKLLELPAVPPVWTKKGPVLVFGQVEGGVAEIGVDVNTEYARVAQACRKNLPGVRMVFRPHPQVLQRDLPRVYEQPLSAMGYEVDPFHSVRLLLSQARVAVTWMSNASVDAVLSGVPVICLSESNVAWDVAEHDIANVADPIIPPKERRQSFLERLAWCQWSIEEFGNGIAWSQLRRKITCR